MFGVLKSFGGRQNSYNVLPQDQFDDPALPNKSKPTSGRRVWLSAFSLALFCYGIGFLCGEHIQDQGLLAKLRPSTDIASSCIEPSYRREWRSLSRLEKAEYLDAVTCLLSQPSRLENQVSKALYHDFPYVHASSGNNVHNTAAFLPYHRYMLHVFEDALRTSCGFNGSLTYWDWTLDWESLSESPVFTSDIGFGGDGNPASNKSVGDGYCVTDGAFANLPLLFDSQQEHEHCLSRSFADGKSRGKLAGDQLRPEVVENILLQPTYEAFLTHLEKGPHNQIPNGIGGDFLTFTAPNDPLFYLHHSQLDRLWWLWQKDNHYARMRDYGGPRHHQSHDVALVTDTISFGSDLAPNMRVSDLLSTSSKLLCYRY